MTEAQPALALSVVVCTYQRLAGLRDSLPAVLAQDPVPVIVTNNRVHFEAMAREFPQLLIVHPDI